MAFEEETEAVEQAISEFGVNEQSLLEIFGNLKLRDIIRFRTSTPETIIVDGVRQFKMIAGYDSERMRPCFLHFHKALEMSTKHPYERDASLMRSAFEGEGVLPKKILVEIICTRTPAQLVGARMVYQTMYKTTVEKQLQACTPQTLEHKLLAMMLVGDYGEANSDNELEDLQRDVRKQFQTLRLGGENGFVELITNETIHFIDMVLKGQNQLVNHASLNNNVDDYEIIRVILKCRCDPVSYFLEVLDDAFETNDADALTRVIVTRTYVDMTEIKKAYLAKHNMSLQQKIEDVAKGYYKEFILSLLERSL